MAPAPVAPAVGAAVSEAAPAAAAAEVTTAPTTDGTTGPAVAAVAPPAAGMAPVATAPATVVAPVATAPAVAPSASVAVAGEKRTVSDAADGDAAGDEPEAKRQPPADKEFGDGGSGTAASVNNPAAVVTAGVAPATESA